MDVGLTDSWLIRAGHNWEALLHTLTLKTRQRAQNAKPHVTKSRLNDSFGSPGDGLLNHPLRSALVR